MSIDLNWETLTTGPDGQELAHRIRDFIHEKFQAVQLPRFIKSVTVHDFEFGAVPPEVELKDITDPLPDFYEEDPGADYEEEDEDDDDRDDEARPAERRRPHAGHDAPQYAPPPINTALGGLRGLGQLPTPSFELGSPFLGVSTPGIAAGSGLSYFTSHLAPGLSGTQTPLAAVAGAHLGAAAWLEAEAPARPARRGGHGRQPSHDSSVVSAGDASPPRPDGPPATPHLLREKHSVSTLAPTSAGTSRPPTRDASAPVMDDYDSGDDDEEGTDGGRGGGAGGTPEAGEGGRRFREPRVEDMQAVFRIRYSGDVRLLLTADILLDYPMPSFVGIPVRLSITGLTFDGVGVLANIRRRVHFCFLSPEDALAAVGADDDDGGPPAGGKLGGLLQEIRVESEIGQREGGKQSLKNVGKVERFVLEQVRRIFEEEFVYPSFWTFLV